MSMAAKGVECDAQIAKIAARQHGVISIAQLYAAGLDHNGVAYRVAHGRLHRIHRGVYAVGHTGLTHKGRWKAATLACGDGSALSHRSAAALWGMLEPAGGLIHVTVPVSGGRKRRNGLAIHRTPSLTEAKTTIRETIPVTRPRRTLEDFSRHATSDERRRALRQAEFLRLPIGDFGLLRDRTASELEAIFLRLCRRHGVSEPEVNAQLGPYRADFLWRELGVVVETDSYRYHRGAAAFEDDHRRDTWLVSCGYEVLRFTYRQVVNEPEVAIAVLRKRLDRTQRLVATSESRRAVHSLKRELPPPARPASQS